MPIFFFDVYDGEALVRDEFGLDLVSVEEAVDEAVALLPEMARDALLDHEACDFAAFVRGQDEAVVYRAALLFRGQRTDVPDARVHAGRWTTDELVLQSRATRAAAERVSAGLQESVRELMTIMQDALRGAAQATATATATARRP